MMTQAQINETRDELQRDLAELESSPDRDSVKSRLAFAIICNNLKRLDGEQWRHDNRASILGRLK